MKKRLEKNNKRYYIMYDPIFKFCTFLKSLFHFIYIRELLQLRYVNDASTSIKLIKRHWMSLVYKP